MRADIVHGDEHDLTKRRVQNRKLSEIGNGQVRAATLATPCTSFTIARRGPPPLARGPPPPLRSRELPWGLPGLSEKDVERIRVGNLLARFTIRYALLCLEHLVPFMIENPMTSRLWVLPRMLKLLQKPGAHVVDVDFCQFGTRWRKSTKLVFGNVPAEALEGLAKCRFHGRGCCSCTGKPHLVLSGTAPNGKFWTLIAQAYPKQLCDMVVHALLGN